MEPAIVVDGPGKDYGGVPVVDDVSFVVAPGEVFGLIGPNGSGKTTTVECLQGLRRPDRGSLRVLGLDPIGQRAALRTRIGSQLQESALPDRLRVDEALDLFSALAGRPRDWRRLLADWGLEKVRRRAFVTLSGGQRQRLFVALALVSDPQLVFLDEMTTGLDPAARRTAWALVERVRDAGTTIVMVTHVMEEAERLCDRIVTYVALVIASVGLISLPVHLAAYRERGVLRRLRASGASAPTVVAAQAAVATVLAAVSALIMVIAAMAIYGTGTPRDWLSTAGGLVLVLLEFSAIVVLLGAVLPNARAAQGVGLSLFFGMMFIAGAGPPPEVLSAPLRRIADLLPLTHAVRVVQDPWLDRPWDPVSLTVVVIVTLAAAGVAALVLRRE